MKVKEDTIGGKQKRQFFPRIQKTRLAEIEANLGLLMAKGFTMKRSDASILATAPRELLRPITMEFYASLTSFEKAEYREGCRKVVNGQVKIDKDKLRRVISEKERIRIDKLQDFVLKRRQQRKQIATERSELDLEEPGALLRLAAIREKEAKYAMIGNNAVYAFAAKMEGLGNDMKDKKRKFSGDPDGINGKHSKQLEFFENVPSVARPKISQIVSDPVKAESNVRIVVTGLTTAHTHFLEKCKFFIGEQKKAVIKRKCDGEGFLADVSGKICALHVSQLFVKLDDFAEPLGWFSEGQEIVVFVRDVLELENCPFLTRVRGLSGNLIASITLIPPDMWTLKVPTQFIVYKCQSEQACDDKMPVCIGPTLKGCIPYENWDDKLLYRAADLKDGTALNVYTSRLERTASKFTDFVASRVPRDECHKIHKSLVIPIIRMNVNNILLPCKSRFHGWKLFLPLTEADDDYSETTLYAKLVPSLAVILAVNEKKKTAILSTRVSRLKKATRETSLHSLLPKGPITIVDQGIANARLLHGKKGMELRGFVVKIWEENRVEVLLGMDHLWPIRGHLKDASGTLHKRLRHLAVVKVRMGEDIFETRKGVLVELARGDNTQNEVLTSLDEEKGEIPQETDSTCSLQNPQKVELEDEEGFDWEYEAQPNLTVLAREKMIEDSETSSSSGDEETPPLPKKSKEEREEDRRRKEKAMREAEVKLNKPLFSSDMPKTAEEFDRLVMASPNDGALWVRYIAHHLQQLEVEKARQVAKRGLKLVAGDVADKLSLWLACLNLENMYGTEDSLDSAFKEALKHNDPIKIYSHLAKIYAIAGKAENARDTYQIMVKKFKQNRDVWIDFGSWLFDTGNLQEARQLMKRSFNSLTEREHIEVILRFSQLEFTKGERDFGKSLMDNLLLTYPKRLDLWNVYIDQLIKLNDHAAVRINFNKLVSSKLPLRKIKSVFKKWIDFETKHGNPDSLEKVKQKVVNYIDLERM